MFAMPIRRDLARFMSLMVVVLALLLNPVAVLADALIFCIDTSGSMNEHHKIEAAKAALIQQIEQAQPGDVIYVIAFDSNDYPVGRVEVGEDFSQDAKKDLIAKVSGLKARGRFTNIDECIEGAQSSLLLERAPGAGARKIIVLTDGISDPSPDHRKIDLQGISKMIPQEPGWAVYIVGLPADVAGFFQTEPRESGIVVDPENQRVVGIPVREFSRETIKAAVTTAKDDNLLLPMPSPSQTAGPTPTSPSPRAATRAASASPLPWIMASLALLTVPLALMWLRRAPADLACVVVEVKEDSLSEAKSFTLAFADRMKKTVGARGDIPLTDPDLPAVVCTFEWRSGQLWLSPQDTIAVDGKPVTSKTAVGVGDVIAIRQRITLTLNQPEEQE
jgi:von Willebrand factor type A domain